MHSAIFKLLLPSVALASTAPSILPEFGCIIIPAGNSTKFPRSFFDHENITQIVLPPVSLKAIAKVTGNLASTALTFSYKNPSKTHPINIMFKFPSDVNTAVYKVVAKYENGDIFEAKIEEREKARKTYEQAKTDGTKAALVENVGSQNDVLFLNLANIPASQSAKIMLHTAQTLTESNGYLKYKLATSLFTRYDKTKGKKLRRELKNQLGITNHSRID